MAFDILDHIGTYIKANNSFFNSVRVNGIQLPDGQVIEFTNGQEKQFIGIGDNVGSGAYIRFDPSITHTTERRVSSVRSGAFIKKCRLVAYSFDKSLTSETLMSKLVRDLKNILFSGASRKPVIVIRKSNYNYLDILKEEFKKEIKEMGGYEFCCISIDFDLTYWDGECEVCDPENPNNKYVLIIDQDGNIIARRIPPETYSVLVFDRIVGGAPDSVYVNNVIAGTP